MAEVPPSPGDTLTPPLPLSRRFVADSYTLLRMGQISRAVEVCRAGVGIYPEFAPGWMMMARVLWASGAQEEARTWLQKILEVSPGHNVASYGLEQGLPPQWEPTPPPPSPPTPPRSPRVGVLPENQTRPRVMEPPPPVVVEPPPSTLPAPDRWVTPQEEEDEDDQATLSGPGLISETLADLYRTQGSPEEALKMYEELQHRGQGSPRISDKIRQLREQVRPVDPRIPRLTQWLSHITREEGPL